MPRIAKSLVAGVVFLAIAFLCVAIGRTIALDSPHTADDAVAQFVQADPSEHQHQFRTVTNPEAVATSARSTYPVIIRKPSGPPRVQLAGADPLGRSAIVACSTCHAGRKPNLKNVSASTLDEFHQGMTFHHGNIACYACHNPEDADSLRLADGTRIEYETVMTLCSQCHGPQATAMEHGAHGGMNGHWDLTRGPQIKNNCIDCHDPHQPNYPKMVVGFKPKDRFNEPADHVEDGH
jgi:hypothetical protein